MALVRWAPLLPSTDEFDKFFDEFGGSRIGSFVPALDVYQTQGTVVVETTLAGVDPSKVNISIENNVLTIEGATEHKTEVDEKNYYRKEIRSGAFHRAVALPTSVIGDQAKATYEKGILKIEIPKEEKAKPKTVKIEIK